MKPLRLALVVSTLALAPAAHALPPVGGAMPSFAVNDIAGTRHTQADLLGHWSVALVMTDKDAREILSAWFHRLRGPVGQRARMYTFAALDLFALVPTASVMSEARDSTPRAQWSSVWLSRDGSLRRSLGLPEDETPWVVVVRPDGHIALTLHEPATDAGVARVLALLPEP
ncbi:MAG: hypothetical protein R3A52_31940 [Polyangiales bacterium]